MNLKGISYIASQNLLWSKYHDFETLKGTFEACGLKAIQAICVPNS